MGAPRFGTMLALGLALVSCATQPLATSTASPPATPTPLALAPTSIPAPSPAAAPTPSPDALCRERPPFDGVDQPQSLELIDVCRTVTGAIAGSNPSSDGSRTVILRVDWQFEATLLNLRNMLDEGRMLVLNVPGSIAVPPSGTRVAVTGPFVRDKEHGWNAIYPVRAIEPTGRLAEDEPVGSVEAKRLWAAIRTAWPAIPPMVFDGDGAAGPSAALYPDGLAHVRLNSGSPPETHTVWHEAGHILHASALTSRGALADLFRPADTVGIEYWAARRYPGTWANHLNAEWRTLGYEAFAESFAAVNVGESERTETYGVPLDRVAMRAFFKALAPALR